LGAPEKNPLGNGKIRKLVLCNPKRGHRGDYTRTGIKDTSRRKIGGPLRQKKRERPKHQNKKTKKKKKPHVGGKRKALKRDIFEKSSGVTGTGFGTFEWGKEKKNAAHPLSQKGRKKGAQTKVKKCHPPLHQPSRRKQNRARGQLCPWIKEENKRRGGANEIFNLRVFIKRGERHQEGLPSISQWAMGKGQKKGVGSRYS